MTDKPPVLILGARSDIGMATAHRFAAEGHPVQLAARDVGTLETDRADIALRHDVEATLHEYDALDIEGFSALAEGLDPQPGIVVAVVGLLGDQIADQGDAAAATRVLRTNFEGPALALEYFAGRMEASAEGVLVGISSVAGDRGRASNYIYGAAKAGFTAYLSGLRNRLAKTGVHVLTVKPGFVDTRMTEGMDLPKALTATPEAVAETIVKAVQRRRNVVYVKPIWRLVMMIIRLIPEPVFKKTSL